ncbi:transcription factor WhiB [Aeromicrobium sp. 636]|uniref:Winged helix-turn-helix domain-containing protein n=1 Tax=Aeromicrobium senzhongii TaxID=2663859 RepID=A0A8I0EXF3_9ACTN|nr:MULTISPECIES: winged helix-turn-helix domain-containing protein [Aeromicrobium]MBC9227117.1 winged helix-turn-helix domain-containing protein [Aeromicrobium senzhongii]MCQ3999217.1 transcription factor WhiB [Aeromicrobium sp. 636]MTB88476.1 transcription factor WhiB [Aeromicrobium senzhongii]QNL94562.1 winged helix-turn-helix domain-containing protein [Aeromicrobium senzhongii]
MRPTLPPCAMAPAMYQDEILLSPPSRRDVTAEQWRDYQGKKAAAHRRCAGCSVLDDCLYRAVVEVDVSGFLACTSEADRRAMRRELGIEVRVDSGAYGTARVGGGPVDHNEVMGARRAHPDETCRELAERLGCSTSTVKRHLRQEREGLVESSVATVAQKPTMEQVLDAFDRLDTSRSV